MKNGIPLTLTLSRAARSPKAQGAREREETPPTGAKWVAALAVAAFGFISPAVAAEGSQGPDYAAVYQIFERSCIECHSSQDPEGNLALDTYVALIAGGQSGASLIVGKSEESLLIEFVEGRRKSGEHTVMPPGKREKLTAEQIAVLRSWIDQGAVGPAEDEVIVTSLETPSIPPRNPPARAFQSAAYAPGPNWVAAGRLDTVELRSGGDFDWVRSLKGHRGDVTALAFDSGGDRLFAAAGEPGRFGEVRVWRAGDGALEDVWVKHRDTIYAMALSPDGQRLATGGYDQRILVWNARTGGLVHTLTGHNGAIFGLAFRPDGKILASASADRTVKLWNVESGERVDTLSQPLKQQMAAAFSADGQYLFAGGADHRIRRWRISETAAETTNPILDAKFAHEGTIVRLVMARNGKTLASAGDEGVVKLWDVASLDEKLAVSQSDWPTALDFLKNDEHFLVGRLDGTYDIYETASGKPAPSVKPEITRVTPVSVQTGTERRIKASGKKLADVTEVISQNEDLKLSLDEEISGSERWLTVSSAKTLSPGAYTFQLKSRGQLSENVTLHLDDLAHVYEDSAADEIAELPVNFAGVLTEAGESDVYRFRADDGSNIVIDAAGQRLGSKADLVISIFDEESNLLARENRYHDSMDPLFVFRPPTTGVYRLTVSDLVIGASDQHYYRISVGAFPFATAVQPLGLNIADREARLVGVNLPGNAVVTMGDSKQGIVDVAAPHELARTRGAFKVMVTEGVEAAEHEPNDSLAEARDVQIPGAVSGRVWNGGEPDADLFKFETKAGSRWILETWASRAGSPLDTKLEVLDSAGHPVERVRLQAVRASNVTFRPIDSVTVDCRVENWEEMDLNQLLYLQGEVVKIFRMPQGPDSGFVFFNESGRRRTYFDTSATAHANGEPCYVVEARATGTELVPNGLPSFPIYFANDDEAERSLGTDSRIHFIAPEDGTYLLKVTDTRGLSGEEFVYRVEFREARPGFAVALEAASLSVPDGSGQGFTLKVDRIDGFEGAVDVTIGNVPEGLLISSPLRIEAGHYRAQGTVFAAAGANPPPDDAAGNITITATAEIAGERVTKSVEGFKSIRVTDAPALWVGFAPVGMDPDQRTQPELSQLKDLAEITISPGEIIPASLAVRRNGHKDLVTFTIENLPHGIIVDNIGLNGVLIPKDEDRREIFLNAASWVEEMDRLCFAVANQAGRQTSQPVLLKVRKKSESGQVVSLP